MGGKRTFGQSVGTDEKVNFTHGWEEVATFRKR